MSQSQVPPEMADGVADVGSLESEPMIDAQGSLWRDRNFLTMWSGQALSQVGAQIAELALPVVAVLLLQASAMQLGVLNAAGVAAFLIVGLPAGAWIDRMRKRHVMIGADFVRAVALAVVPVLWWADALRVWHLMAIALVMGVATVFFDVAYQSFVPSLVARSQIAEANGKFEATAQLAGITGPALGGWLVGILTAPIAVLATGVTYVASMVALLFTRDHEVLAPAEHDRSLRRDIGEGLRWVFGNPLLRRIVGTTAVSNFFGTMSFTLLPLFLLRELGFSPVAMGVVFGLGAAGGFLGAVVSPWLVRAIGEARAIPVSAVAFSVTALLVPAAAVAPSLAFAILAVQGFLSSVAVLTYNVVQVTFRQRITPMRLLGRMNASIRFVVWGVMPLAALLGGWLGTAIGVIPTMWIAAVGGLASSLFVVLGPFWQMSELPDAAQEASA